MIGFSTFMHSCPGLRHGWLAAATTLAMAILAPPAVAQAPAAVDRAALQAHRSALFERMMRDPADPAVTLAYAGVTARLEDNEAAAGALERLLIENPALPAAALELGVLYYRMGSFKAARAYFARAKASGASPEQQQKIARYEDMARLERVQAPPSPQAAPPLMQASLAVPRDSAKVGTAAAVNQNATAGLAGTTGHRLAVRDAVFTGERVRTDAQGQVQLLLDDASTVTIGPQSDLAVETLAAGPQNASGGMRLDLARGRLLLIGGRLSKQPNAVGIRTPSATLAVRGAIVLVEILPNGGTRAVLLYGDSMTMTGAGGDSKTVSEPGFAISLSSPGGSPSSPFAISVADLAALLGGMEGRSGGNGGAANPVTEADLARSGIGQIISGNLIDSIRQALHASLDEATVAASGPMQTPLDLFGTGRAFGQGVSTNRCVTVSPSRPCR